MNLFARFAPGLPDVFRAHLHSGLIMFAFLVILPLTVTYMTMNWLVRRITGDIMVLLFFGMVFGAAATSTNVLGALAGALVPAMLIGAMLYFLSHPVVMREMDDYYNSLNVRDLRYAFRRKVRPRNLQRNPVRH